MTKYLIVPGYNGSEAGHWQHHWLHDNDDAFWLNRKAGPIRYSGFGCTSWKPN